MVTSINSSTETYVSFLNQIVEKSIRTQAETLISLTDSLHQINIFASFPLSGLKQSFIDIVA